MVLSLVHIFSLCNNYTGGDVGGGKTEMQILIRLKVRIVVALLTGVPQAAVATGSCLIGLTFNISSD